MNAKKLAKPTAKKGLPKTVLKESKRPAPIEAKYSKLVKLAERPSPMAPIHR